MFITALYFLCFDTYVGKDCTPGCVTNMLRDLGLQLLQNRRKRQRITLFFKIVRGLTPAFPAKEFLTAVNSTRLINPRNPTDIKTTNIVTDHARNNLQEL